ncbi:MAG: hypothetical protein ACLQIQ_19925 [Beijerinckiaceae bacterium]
MRQVGLNAVLWAAFALLILTGGYVMLRACDFGFLPLFGTTSCALPTHDAELAAEREREAHLRSSIHSEEIRLALLPTCPNPLPQKPEPQPKPEPKPVIVEEFKIPKKVEELKGCWQTARGDIDMTTDDAARTPIGKVRICYCFRANGQGMVQSRYTDGDICQGSLRAQISPDHKHVFMHHDQVNCQKHGYQVPADITCGNDQSDQTTCEIQNLGRIGNKFSEQFIRVSDEHCGWNG